MKKDFIPGANSRLNIFAKNFYQNLGKNASKLSLPEKDVSVTKKSIGKLNASYNAMIDLKAKSKAATETFYAAKERTKKTLRRMSVRIKSSSEYDRSIGQLFQIINNSKPVKDFSNHKPALKVSVNAGNVIIKFTKNGTQGIQLYSRSGKQKTFSELALIYKGVYKDIRPKKRKSLVEIREYYAEYISKDRMVGKKSDVVKIIIP